MKAVRVTAMQRQEDVSGLLDNKPFKNKDDMSMCFYGVSFAASADPGGYCSAQMGAATAHVLLWIVGLVFSWSNVTNVKDSSHSFGVVLAGAICPSVAFLVLLIMIITRILRPTNPLVRHDRPNMPMLLVAVMTAGPRLGLLFDMLAYITARSDLKDGKIDDFQVALIIAITCKYAIGAILNNNFTKAGVHDAGFK